MTTRAHHRIQIENNQQQQRNDPTRNNPKQGKQTDTDNEPKRNCKCELRKSIYDFERPSDVTFPNVLYTLNVIYV